MGSEKPVLEKPELLSALEKLKQNLSAEKLASGLDQQPLAGYSHLDREQIVSRFIPIIENVIDRTAVSIEENYENLPSEVLTAILDGQGRIQSTTPQLYDIELDQISTAKNLAGYQSLSIEVFQVVFSQEMLDLVHIANSKDDPVLDSAVGKINSKMETFYDILKDYLIKMQDSSIDLQYLPMMYNGKLGIRVGLDSKEIRAIFAVISEYLKNLSGFIDKSTAPVVSDLLKNPVTAIAMTLQQIVG